MDGCQIKREEKGESKQGGREENVEADPKKKT